MATWNSRGLRGSTLEEFINFSNDAYTKNDQSTREYYTEYLDLAMSHGCTAYTLEYATVPSIRRQAAAYAVKHGYICYISDNIGLCLGR